jgi:hypothetical protein
MRRPRPEGVAPRIVNFGDWSAPELYAELAELPGVRTDATTSNRVAAEIVLPLRLRDGDGELGFICTQTTFGTAIDVTLSELTIEAFYPADTATANRIFGRD